MLTYLLLLAQIAIFLGAQVGAASGPRIGPTA